MIDATERTVAWKIFAVEKVSWVDETTKSFKQLFLNDKINIFPVSLKATLVL